MEKFIKVNLLMDKNRGLEHIIMLTETFILECGLKISEMVKVRCIIRMVFSMMGNGKKMIDMDLEY